jgi:hypothetical protein
MFIKSNVVGSVLTFFLIVHGRDAKSNSGSLIIGWKEQHTKEMLLF